MTVWLDFEKPVLELEQKIQELRASASERGLEAGDELGELERKAEAMRREIYANLTRYQRVQIARHPKRPYALDYLERCFTDFRELHGDRHFADDPAIVGGLAWFEGRPVVVIGQQKGRDTKENLHRRFGMPNPEGYRKALRLMQLADRFHLPVVTLVDTPGAYPGLGAEERGQAEAIAVADRVLMFENSVYSVISPEGCASILWRDGKQGAKAAEALRLAAPDLQALGIVDGVLPEPVGGAHRDWETAARTLADALRENLEALSGVPGKELVRRRAERFRRIGVFSGGEA